MEDQKNNINEIEKVVESKPQDIFTKNDFENYMSEFKNDLGKMVLDQTLTVIKNFINKDVQEPQVEKAKSKDTKISDF